MASLWNGARVEVTSPLAVWGLERWWTTAVSFFGLAGSRNATHTKRVGGSGPVCLASTKPDGGVFIAEKTIRDKHFHEY